MRSPRIPQRQIRLSTIGLISLLTVARGHHRGRPETNALRLVFSEMSELASASTGFTQWSADNKYVYFDTGFSADPAVYRVRIADRKLERLADLKKPPARVVTDRLSWSGLTPEGSPLLMRDVGAQEVYALDFESP